MFIHYFSLLLVCQLIGEVLGLWLRLPIPGPVIGMLLLFVGLLVKGGIPRGLARTAEGLLVHLSLLFVPAGVGVMLHVSLLADQWAALTLALIVSTAFTLVITAWIMQRLARYDHSGTPR
ncbi:MAG: CidA/LrgA family protein [Proteobacteria bacterium]|nr:MAG: CidA/LrgA family protein [Pseudomonadota bacterium]